MSRSLFVEGLVYSPGTVGCTKLSVTVSNDEFGQTISVCDGVTQFTVPFEPVLKALVEEGVESRKLNKLLDDLKAVQGPKSTQHHKRKKKR